VKAIADTGFLVAFLNRRDQHHAWAVALAGEVVEPLLTCEAVLSEATFHVQSAGLVLELVEQGLVTLAFDAKKNLKELRKLATRYADRQPDFADLCLVRMSELNPKHSVITVDTKDFSVFRRNGRETIPLLAPADR
jgi:predicted nucleic acid-binding protein